MKSPNQVPPCLFCGLLATLLAAPQSFLIEPLGLAQMIAVPGGQSGRSVIFDLLLIVADIGGVRTILQLAAHLLEFLPSGRPIVGIVRLQERPTLLVLHFGIGRPKRPEEGAGTEEEQDHQHDRPIEELPQGAAAVLRVQFAAQQPAHQRGRPFPLHRPDLPGMQRIAGLSRFAGDGLHRRLAAAPVCGVSCPGGGAAHRHRADASRGPFPGVDK